MPPARGASFSQPTGHQLTRLNERPSPESQIRHSFRALRRNLLQEYVPCGPTPFHSLTIRTRAPGRFVRRHRNRKGRDCTFRLLRALRLCQANARPCLARDRPVAIPHWLRPAGEGLTGRDRCAGNFRWAKRTRLLARPTGVGEAEDCLAGLPGVCVRPEHRNGYHGSVFRQLEFSPLIISAN
jgi:hypothetical protein